MKYFFIICILVNHKLHNAFLGKNRKNVAVNLSLGKAPSGFLTTASDVKRPFLALPFADIVGEQVTDTVQIKVVGKLFCFLASTNDRGRIVILEEDLLLVFLCSWHL